jgi:hypothetical protein
MPTLCDAPFIPTRRAALALGVPHAWLKREIEARRLPAVRVGRRWLVHLNRARDILAKRADARCGVAMPPVASADESDSLVVAQQEADSTAGAGPGASGMPHSSKPRYDTTSIPSKELAASSGRNSLTAPIRASQQEVRHGS